MTAVSVKEILPMAHGELLELTMLVNDDDLDKSTIEAAHVNNGHLLHAYKDNSGEQRQSFYSL